MVKRRIYPISFDKNRTTTYYYTKDFRRLLLKTEDFFQYSNRLQFSKIRALLKNYTLSLPVP